MRPPMNHHSSPPKSMWLPGMTPWMAGVAPWPTSTATAKDWGATSLPKRLSAAQSSS